MPFQEKIITCADCGQQFTHSVADQQRYAQRGLTNDPKRCKPCREKRRQQQGAKAANSGRPASDAAAEAPRPRRQGRGRFFPASEPKRRPEFHPATCAGCGRETTVPFKPVEGRPVYCRDCFQKSKGLNSAGPSRSRSTDDEFGEGLA